MPGGVGMSAGVAVGEESQQPTWPTSGTTAGAPTARRSAGIPRSPRACAAERVRREPVRGRWRLGAGSAGQSGELDDVTNDLLIDVVNTLEEPLWMVSAQRA
jgi:hypothetical protein